MYKPPNDDNTTNYKS